VKVLIYEGVQNASIVDWPMPTAGRGEAVVKIALCGICGTDLHIYFEGMLPPPFVPGHENVGTIASRTARTKPSWLSTISPMAASRPPVCSPT
jgi:D-arabinose 1-dehydrogenase-like Zn-dependent alcohol dehydrogenase